MDLATETYESALMGWVLDEFHSGLTVESALTINRLRVYLLPGDFQDLAFGRVWDSALRTLDQVNVRELQDPEYATTVADEFDQNLSWCLDPLWLRLQQVEMDKEHQPSPEPWAVLVVKCSVRRRIDVMAPFLKIALRSPTPDPALERLGNVLLASLYQLRAAGEKDVDAFLAGEVGHEISSGSWRNFLPNFEDYAQLGVQQAQRFASTSGVERADAPRYDDTTRAVLETSTLALLMRDGMSADLLKDGVVLSEHFTGARRNLAAAMQTLTKSDVPINSATLLHQLKRDPFFKTMPVQDLRARVLQLKSLPTIGTPQDGRRTVLEFVRSVSIESTLDVFRNALDAPGEVAPVAMQAARAVHHSALVARTLASSSPAVALTAGRGTSLLPVRTARPDQVR